MHPAFIAKQTGLHIFQVICHRFLIALYITLQLELLCFQVIAGIIFVGNSERSNIHLHQTADHIPFAPHCQHLEYTVLSTVVRVFGTSFTLCNPDGLILFSDCIVHITGHAGRRLKHLPHGQCTLHDK